MDQPAEQNMVSVLCTYDAEQAGIAAEWLGDNKIPFNRRFDRSRGSSGTIDLLVSECDANKAFARLNEWRNFRESLPDAPIPTDPNYERINKKQFAIGFIISSAIFIISIFMNMRLRFMMTLTLVFIPLVCAVAIRAYGYWRHLRALGYSWATLEDANDIIWRVGKKAYAIPSAVEAEILPGYNPDAAYIIRLLNSYYHPDRIRFNRGLQRRSMSPVPSQGARYRHKKQPMTAPVANQPLLSVYRANDPILAGLAAECLQNNEIPFTRKEDTRTMDGGYEVSVGTIELLVAAERVNEAAVILDKWECLRKNAAAAAPKPPTPSGSFENVKYEAMYFAFCLILVLISLVSIGRVPYIAIIIFLPSLQSLIRVLWAYSYWRHMRSLGYEWPTLGDAYEIKTSLGYRKAYALPPAADVALLPGYKPDVDGIYHFLICFNDYKREAARKRGKKKP